MDRFAPYGGVHLAVVLLSVAFWYAVIRRARRVRGTRAERRLRLVYGGAILAVCGGWMFYGLTPGAWDVRESIPLHLCDLAWMAAAWSVLSGGDPARLQHQLTFYWTLGFSTLGYLTPTVTEGPASASFLAFFASHWLVVGAGFLNYHGFGWRPTKRGLLQAVVASTLLYAVATAVNLALDTNYCYSGRSTPVHPTPVDLFGPWPLRILWIWAVSMGVLLLLSLKSRPGAALAGIRSGASGGAGPGGRPGAQTP